MANVPVPRGAEGARHAAELSGSAAVAPDNEIVALRLPDPVQHVLSTLATAGHEAVLVGGVVRDHLLGQATTEMEWDAATSAEPAVVAGLFPSATWENRFGTVTVRGLPSVEVTSYRTESGYADARRPDEVRFGASLVEDLARRDFTINAMAWLPVDLAAGSGRIIDPHGGRADLASRLLRTVGDPSVRFTEDALRLVRAARFAAGLELTVDPATEAAIVALAPRVASVSGERVRDELLRILDLDQPSRALRLIQRLGLLAVILPELAALRGVPQAKVVPGDALDHSLAAVDAVPANAPPDTRLAALLHDLGKATTLADGHFIGHETVGAALAADVLARLHLGRARSERIINAIRQHMYHYEATWSDAAVRRLVRRLAGTDRDLLFALRRADDAASGTSAAAGPVQAQLEARIAAELERQSVLLLERRLAVDGHDLQRELGLPPGPEIGRLMERLLDAAIDDPSINDRATLIARARALAGR